MVMIKRKSKYCSASKAAILKLASIGYTEKEICVKLGFSSSTIQYLKKSDKRFKDMFDSCRDSAMKSLISDSLTELARGVDKVEETSRYFDEVELDDGTIRKIEVTKKVRRLPPDIGALKMLSHAYDRGTYLESMAKELNVDIKITQQDRSLTIEERKKLIDLDNKGESIEGVYKAIGSGEEANGDDS